MKRRSTAGVAGISLALASWMLAAVSVLAHHSFGAEYDGDKPVTLTGVVTKIDWTNPHSYFHIDVTDNGVVTNWKFEGYPPSVLSRIVWKRDATIKLVDTMTIYGLRARRHSN